MKKEYRPLLLSMLSLQTRHQVEQQGLNRIFLIQTNYLPPLITYKQRKNKEEACPEPLGHWAVIQGLRVQVPPLPLALFFVSSLEFKSLATLVK